MKHIPLKNVPGLEAVNKMAEMAYRQEKRMEIWTIFDLKKFQRRKINKSRKILSSIERLFFLLKSDKEIQLKKMKSDLIQKAYTSMWIRIPIAKEIVSTMNDIWLNGTDSEIEEMNRLVA